MNRDDLVVCPGVYPLTAIICSGVPYCDVCDEWDLAQNSKVCQAIIHEVPHLHAMGIHEVPHLHAHTARVLVHW